MGIGNFAFFSKKIMENIKIFHSYCKIDAECRNTFSDPSATLLASMLYRSSKCFYDEAVGMVTFGQVTKTAVTPFDPQLPKIPCYTQTSRLYLIKNRIYYRLNFFALYE